MMEGLKNNAHLKEEYLSLKERYQVDIEIYLDCKNTIETVVSSLLSDEDNKAFKEASRKNGKVDIYLKKAKLSAPQKWRYQYISSFSKHIYEINQGLTDPSLAKEFTVEHLSFFNGAK